MIPKFPEFRKLVANHKEAIEAYTRIFPPYSDYTFPSLWSWNIHEQIELSDLNGNLVVRFTDYVTNEKFLSFLGDKEVNKTLEALFALIERAPDHLNYLKLIPEHNLHGVHLSNGFEAVEDLNNHDYIYSVRELTTFSGKKYVKKRNQLAQFLGKYESKLVELNLSCCETQQLMQNLCEVWTQKQLEKKNDVFNDVSALQRLFLIANNAKILGIGIYVDDRLCGYNITELNHQSFATGLFELADTAYAGVYAYLRKQLAVRLQERGAEWLNHQQDLGIAGLRISKQRFHPAFFLKKFIIRRTKEIAL